jgi:hypothetical protein
MGANFQGGTERHFIGIDVLADWLQKRGYKLTFHSRGGGGADMIGEAKDHTLIVEVKNAGYSQYSTPIYQAVGQLLFYRFVYVGRGMIKVLPIKLAIALCLDEEDWAFSSDSRQPLEKLFLKRISGPIEEFLRAFNISLFIIKFPKKTVEQIA